MSLTRREAEERARDYDAPHYSESEMRKWLEEEGADYFDASGVAEDVCRD